MFEITSNIVHLIVEAGVGRALNVIFTVLPHSGLQACH